MQSIRNPNLAWYQSISAEKNLTPRCPFTSFKRCPKFFFSYSLLDLCHKSNALSKSDDEEIMQYWQNTNYLPIPKEKEPNISGESGQNIRNFCPEVAGSEYGYFSSLIHCYADDIDREIANKYLIKEKANKDDYRRNYSSIKPMHYSECEYYSILSYDKNK